MQGVLDKANPFLLGSKGRKTASSHPMGENRGLLGACPRRKATGEDQAKQTRHGAG